MSHNLMFISRNFCWFCGESDVITCLLNFNMKKKQLFLLKFQNILIMLLGSQDTNNALFLDLFLSNFRKTYWVKRIPNKNFGDHFSMPTFAFSCRQASTSFVVLNRNYVYKSSVTYFCGMCFTKCTEWWSSSLVKSSGWTSGGPTAYRLIGRVTGSCFVVIFHTVFWERSDGGQLSSLSSRQLVDHDQVACFCLGDVISEGQSSQLQRQRCVGSSDYS